LKASDTLATGRPATVHAPGGVSAAANDVIVGLSTMARTSSRTNTPWKLLPAMVRNPDRYLLAGTRDFVEIDSR
jgi:hypothetical protein